MRIVVLGDSWVIGSSLVKTLEGRGHSYSFNT